MPTGRPLGVTARRITTILPGPMTTAMGIQWHVLAMFVPSFFTGKLIARFWQAPHRGSGHADDCHGQHACLAGSGAVSLSGAR
jgi:hypothetical protein